MKNELLRLNSITKSHQGRSILCNASLCMYAQEVHAVITDNSIAKDAMIGVMTGAQPFDDGEIYIEEVELKPQEAPEKLRSLVAYVRNGEDVVKSLSIAENVFLLNGRKNEREWLSHKRMRLNAMKLFLRMGINELNPAKNVEKLTALEKKLVVIARAVSSGAKLIILDDVTAELEEEATDRIYQLLGLLKESGISFLYITSRLKEVYKIADRISVIHDCGVVNTADVTISPKEKISAMIWGDKIRRRDPGTGSRESEKTEVLRVEKLSLNGMKDISFSLYAGEIAWISGLSSAGQEELGRALFGLEGKCRGNIHIDGRPVEIKSPFDAIYYRIAYVPGRRLDQILIMDKSLSNNLSLGVLDRISRFGKIDLRLEKYICSEWMKRLSLESGSSVGQVMSLNTSEQYKIAVGRALATAPKILILSFSIPEIGFEVFVQLMNHIKDLCGKGMAVLLLAPEVERVIEYVDRVLLMEKGSIKKVINRNEMQAQFLISE